MGGVPKNEVYFRHNWKQFQQGKNAMQQKTMIWLHKRLTKIQKQEKLLYMGDGMRDKLLKNGNSPDYRNIKKARI